MLASPPVRAEMDEELVAKTPRCSVVAKASRSLYGDAPPFMTVEGHKMLSCLREHCHGLDKTYGTAEVVAARK